MQSEERVMMKKPKITVIGSINMDLVTSTDKFPEQGETIRGTQFQTSPGGKGANQAVAAARLGANVNMIGLVGEDSFGEQLLTNLHNEDVDVTNVAKQKGTSTGLANIVLSEKDNRIIIIGGANEYVIPSYLEKCKEAIIESDYVLLQFEIPKQTIEYCLEICAEHHIPVIVNPAPAMKLSKKAWKQATYITPNETEKKQLFQNQLDERFIITEGKQGVSYMEDNQPKHVAAHDVEVLDTTGAGDTFNGALAVALAEGRSVTEAIIFANGAAALSVQKIGAQSGMPTKEQVFNFLHKD